MGYQTLSPTNGFSFTCPIFDVETRMAACVKLRTLFWRGERVEVRRGCQACMSAGKCPVAIIVQRMAMSNKPLADDYGTTEPRSGKLRGDVLQQILPVVVMQSDLNRFGVPDTEANLINSASERIAKQLGVAPSATAASRAKMQSAPLRSTKPVGRSKAEKFAEVEKVMSKPADLTAAETGDLSAAINQDSQT